MGNSSSKDSRSRSGTASHSQQQPLDSTIPPQSRSAEFRGVPDIYTIRASSSAAAGGRGNRQDVPVFISSRRGGGGAENGSASTTREDRPRETRQEREARRAERERQARLKERERSMREEGVDGGFLVTLGVYTGPEDFSKSIVRQLQIERRLAPFWKGLNDHSDSWAEHQLVAAVHGLPIPAPDEIPPEMARTASQTSSNNAKGSDVNVNSLTIPISSRSQSYESSTSANLSASHPAFSNSSGNNTPSAAQLLRGRAKTLASLATGSKSQSPDLTPQEIRLPHDPNVNGTPIEAYLYKDASECPICFMYYPPYLNKTRCCDQPICSECFVQIKRPDPHPPEHEQPGAPPRPPEEEAETLVSEVASCPFCVTPEFGVSYDPPPFRRGLAYANQNGAAGAGHNPLRNPTSAMSSSTSLISGGSGSGAGGGGRRRATSLSANAPQVITTDRVRPEWAKKLADARANALRRSAAATALHNAAYVLGGQGGSGEDGGGRGSGSGALAGFRRRGRRALLVDSPGSGSATPGGVGGGEGDDGANSSSDLYPERGSSARARVARSRVEDIEELMMMEAIRLSLAAEEERKRKEEKDLRKEAKKRDKEAKKEAKREAEAVEKAAKKNNGSISSLAGIGSSKGASGSGSGLLPPPSPRAPSASAGSGTGLYQAGPNDSTSTIASVVSEGTPGAGSASNLASPVLPQGQPQQGIIPEEESSQSGPAAAQTHQSNKGKEPAQDFAGFNPLNEPTSTLNTEMKTKKEDEASSPASAAAGGVSGDGEHNESHSNSLDTTTAAKIEDPQQHLEASRANLQPVAAAAAASAEADRGTGEHTPNEITPNEGEEPLLNYASLAKSMGLGDSEGGGTAAEKDGHEAEHHEGVLPSTAKMVDGDDATTAAAAAGSTGLAGKDD